MHWSSQANSVYDGTQLLKFQAKGIPGYCKHRTMHSIFGTLFCFFCGSLGMEKEKEVGEEEEEKMKKKQQQQHQ